MHCGKHLSETEALCNVSNLSSACHSRAIVFDCFPNFHFYSPNVDTLQTTPKWDNVTNLHSVSISGKIDPTLTNHSNVECLLQIENATYEKSIEFKVRNTT